MKITFGHILFAKAFKKTKDHYPTKAKARLWYYIHATLEKEACQEKLRKLKLDSAGFLEGVFGGYVSKCGRSGDFRSFNSSGHNYAQYLAVFCGYDNFNEFRNAERTETDEEIKQLLDECFEKYEPAESSSSKTAVKTIQWPPPFVKLPQYFEELEFGTRRIRVNCISYSLLWAATFIESKAKLIAKGQNEYRYILTEKSGHDNRDRLDTVIKENPGLSSKIFVQFLYDSELSNDLKANDMVFPLFNDIVFYEEWDPANDKFRFIEAIIGITPNQPKNINFSIEITYERGDALFRWFETIWKRLAGPAKSVSNE